ncbi:MAG: DUF4294 domain-containing protein [Bacteroidota bacterium]
MISLLNKGFMDRFKFFSVLLWIIMAMAGIDIKAQNTIDSLVYVCRGEVIGDDTLIVSSIDEVYIFPPLTFKNSWEERKYRRLIRNVKKAYPYAKLAGKKLNEVNDYMCTLQTEKQRKEYIKQVEQELKDEFEEDLKNLTITQGRILIKLVDRETGETSYELVKELKGSFSAFFWQALARLFGSNLKTEYDPAGEDKLIEDIVQKIERGQL